MKCWTTNFCTHASEGQFIIKHQLKSVYNSPFKDLHSHPIHTCLSVIANNDSGSTLNQLAAVCIGIQQNTSTLESRIIYDTPSKMCKMRYPLYLVLGKFNISLLLLNSSFVPLLCLKHN